MSEDLVRAADRPVRSAEPGPGLYGREIALVDLLDRVLAGGVVLAGDITISVADVDLVHVSLRALITSVRPPGPHRPGR
jgi:hypothetical protein